MKAAGIRAYLVGGDRRSIGRSDALVTLLERQPQLLPDVIREMWNDDVLVAMRAADAVEKLTRSRPDGLKPFKKELLGLAEETSQQELRWHLSAMMPRLQLSSSECRRVIQILTLYLEDKSSIVRTFALQGLFDFAVVHTELRRQVKDLLASTLHAGTAAMRARSRKLLSRIATEWRE